MIKGVIFDLDGTILDSMHIWKQLPGIYLNRMGVQTEGNLSDAMSSMSMEEGAEFLKDQYLPEMDVEEIRSGIICTIEHFYDRHVQLKSGADQFLQDVKNAGIRMVAATSSDRRIVERTLIKLGVIRYFEKIFTSTEIGVGKEKPDIYFIASEFMGTPPKDTWVFEDALHATLTAKKAGFKTVGVFDASSIKDWEKIKRNSDIYLKELDNFDAFLKETSFKWE